MHDLKEIFNEKVLKQLLPPERIEAFFEAFYFGEEPAYHLQLGWGESTEGLVRLELQLHARPGKCLACNLTWGLPQVLEKHPLLNLDKTVQDFEKLLPQGHKVKKWYLGHTEERSPELHVIPLLIELTS